MNDRFIEFDDIKVKVVFRKGQRHLRIRVGSDGQSVVSVPKRYPLMLVRAFIADKKDWIRQHSHSKELIRDGAKLYTGHHVRVNERTSARNKVVIHDELIEFSLSADATSPDSQKYMLSKIHKLYTTLLKDYVAQRLDHFATLTGLSYQYVEVKHLRSRWGHCDRNKNITFSTYLITCDDPLIDYVVLHELTHTKHMNHSTDFWQDLAKYMPQYAHYKKALKQQKMRVTT
jgi:predicted metal-dependent hydrolase